MITHHQWTHNLHPRSRRIILLSSRVSLFHFFFIFFRLFMFLFAPIAGLIDHFLWDHGHDLQSFVSSLYTALHIVYLSCITFKFSFQFINTLRKFVVGIDIGMEPRPWSGIVVKTTEKLYYP